MNMNNNNGEILTEKWMQENGFILHAGRYWTINGSKRFEGFMVKVWHNGGDNIYECRFNGNQVLQHCETISQLKKLYLKLTKMSIG